MTAPEQISIRGIDDYLSAIARMVFQSGMGRTVVDAKWADINDAFDGFDCAAVADYDPATSIGSATTTGGSFGIDARSK